MSNFNNSSGKKKDFIIEDKQFGKQHRGVYIVKYLGLNSLFFMPVFVLRAQTVGKPDGGWKEPHVYSFHVEKHHENWQFFQPHRD